MGYTTEAHMTIYNDETGQSVTVRPDSDGLGLVEIRGEHSGRIVLNPEEARRVSYSILRVLDYMRWEG